MQNAILELYKLHNWRFKGTLMENFKTKYGQVNPEILKVYEQLIYGKLSPLKTTSLTIDEEKLLTDFDPNIILAIYYNLYNLAKSSITKDDERVVFLKNSQGFKMVTKCVEGLCLPIFSLEGHLESDGNQEILQDINVKFYQTEFNKQARRDYLEQLYSYYQQLIANGEDVTFYLAKMDELSQRENVSRTAEFDLMSTQLDYRERIMSALDVQPQEFFAGIYPHIFPDGRTLTRKKMKVNVEDSYLIY